MSSTVWMIELTDHFEQPITNQVSNGLISTRTSLRQEERLEVVWSLRGRGVGVIKRN